MTPDDLKRAGVRVRPAKWQHFPSIGADTPEQWYANVQETYEALTVTFDSTCPAGWQWVARPFPPEGSNFPTPDEAKAALERARENRILSALEPIHEPL